MMKIFFCVILFFPHLIFSSQFVINGEPPALTTKEVIAGQAPRPSLDDSQTYSVALEGDYNGTIYVQLLNSLPKNTQLEVALEAPAGAYNYGRVDLSDCDEHIAISHIQKGVHSNLKITYFFSTSMESELTPPTLYTVNFRYVDNGIG